MGKAQLYFLHLEAIAPFEEGIAHDADGGEGQRFSYAD
jgi:hypothetical protein